MIDIRVFIAPRSGEQSSQNFRKTIEGGYNKKEIDEFLSLKDKQGLEGHDTLMIWGNKPSLKSRWDKMQENDWVLFYQHGNITYAGKLLYKTHNKVLADQLWGPQRNENGELVSWEFVFFLKDLKKINIPFETMAELAGYKGSVIQGFTPYSEKGVKKILEIYGSIDNFLFNKPENNIMDTKRIFVNDNNKEAEYERILKAIKTKPFILLAGLSGTGKSRIARTLAFKTCAKKELQKDSKKPGNFELIPVRPNWHDSSELLGYISRINKEKYITTGFLKFIAKAWKNLDTPFFLCLDEMNLAPVEQYFAEYLSVIETRQKKSDELWTDYMISKSGFENVELYNQILRDLDLYNNPKFKDGISIPKNLIVIGTVNMDETTHSFSRKVLDRAMTFEMNEIDLTAGLDAKQNDWQYPLDFFKVEDVIGEFTAGSEVVSQFSESKDVIEFLQKINLQLEGSPFKIAYRVRDEFLIYCYYSSLTKTKPNWLQDALDEVTSMKVLSRIEGDESKTGRILEGLQKILTPDFRKSNAKLIEMEIRLQNSGYTSYWN